MWNVMDHSLGGHMEKDSGGHGRRIWNLIDHSFGRHMENAFRGPRATDFGCDKAYTRGAHGKRIPGQWATDLGPDKPFTQGPHGKAFRGGTRYGFGT